MSKGERPFRVLGWHLKLAREQLSESLDEVSGAVEVDTSELEHIERGLKRPSEDVLMLLISHLGLEDIEANSLWEMAGYTSGNNRQDDDAVSIAKNKVLYTDLIHVVANDSGVVMNFLQTDSMAGQPTPIARVGMSKTQAKYMLSMLQQTLRPSKKLNAKNLPHKNQLIDEGKDAGNQREQ